MQKDYANGRRYTVANPPYQRIFFEFSHEAASQPSPGRRAPQDDGSGGSGGGGLDVQQAAFLQGQLRDKDRRIQELSGQLAEQEGKAQRVQQDLELARCG